MPDLWKDTNCLTNVWKRAFMRATTYVYTVIGILYIWFNIGSRYCSAALILSI